MLASTSTIEQLFLFCFSFVCFVVFLFACFSLKHNLHFIMQPWFYNALNILAFNVASLHAAKWKHFQNLKVINLLEDCYSHFHNVLIFSIFALSVA